MWSADHVIMWPCDCVIVWLCDQVIMWPCDHVIVWPGFLGGLAAEECSSGAEGEAKRSEAGSEEASSQY